jgi:hypothetical protein
VVLAGMQVNESHPLASLKVSEVSSSGAEKEKKKAALGEGANYVFSDYVREKSKRSLKRLRARKKQTTSSQTTFAGRARATQYLRTGWGLAVYFASLHCTRHLTSLLSSVHEAVKRKRERGGYKAGVVSVVCHEVPMDKGTSESSLLGAGSPLPSIPLHSSRRVLYRLRPYTSMERKDFLTKNLHFSIVPFIPLFP